MPQDQHRENRFVRASAVEIVEMHIDMSEEPFDARNVTGKMPRPRPGTTVLYEPAQWKCTWTSRKNNFMREFTGKMTQTQDGWSTLIKPRPLRLL